MIKCKTVVSLDLRFASKEHVNDIRKPKGVHMDYEEFSIVVAGGRTFNDYELMQSKLDQILQDKTQQGVIITIISGTAGGADKMGEKYAKDRGLNLKLMPAQWDTHGRSAGYRRNWAMAQVADAVVVFWDGTSKGSKHMADIAKLSNLPLRVIKY